VKTGMLERSCKPSTSKAAVENRRRNWEKYVGSGSGTWWDSGRYGQAVVSMNSKTLLSEYVPAPENKRMWPDVMERLRYRRDLKKMRKERRKR